MGRTLEVVEIILNEEGSLNFLSECYSGSDATVRLRVSNSFKSIFRQNPNLFIEYVDKFQPLIKTLNQLYAKRTLAKLHLEFCFLLTEKQKSIAINISKEQLKKL